MLEEPNHLINIMSVLVEFCQRKYAVMEDIKSTFHLVNMKPKGKDPLRFILKEKLEDSLIEHYMLVHVFGKVDFPCCTNWPFKGVPKYPDLPLSNTINTNFHMDNFLKPLSNENEFNSLSNLLITTLPF